MKITNSWKEQLTGLTCYAEYEDCDDYNNLPYEHVTQVALFAFYQKQLIVVHDGNKNSWGPVCGGIETGESYEQCATRELAEESNTTPISLLPIGFQYVHADHRPSEYQLRMFAEVEKIGEFMSDPDGDIDKIRFIDPSDYKQYFDWGPVGERLLQRSLELF